MSKTVRVGNLAVETSANRLTEICGAFGRVSKIRMLESPLSGKSRGIAYVQMETEEQAASCVAGLNEKEHDGKRLDVVDAPAMEVKKYVGRR